MNTRTSQKGVTLMELMIVAAIVGILSSFAYYNYNQSVYKANRTDGRSTMMETATTLEKCRAVYGTYDNAGCSIADGDNIDSLEGHYQISVATTATTFDLTAAPQGGQTNDNCTEITLNHLLEQGGTPSADECW